MIKLTMSLESTDSELYKRVQDLARDLVMEAEKTDEALVSNWTTSFNPNSKRGPGILGTKSKGRR